MEIELSDTSLAFIEAQMERGFESPSEVIEQAIGMMMLDMWPEEEKAALRESLIETEKSLAEGHWVDVDDGYFDRLRERIRKKAAAQQKRAG
jgi:Arc/MetJ-type ribon-helix-helix transcriptional regulator